VTVVFDQDLKGLEHLGVHPNDNTATLILSYDDILTFVTGQGNPVRHITVRG
jgi:Ala-tRNA(Pro) deacylase